MLTYLINFTLEMRFDSVLSFIHSLQTILNRQVHNNLETHVLHIIKYATQITVKTQQANVQKFAFQNACVQFMVFISIIIRYEYNKHHGRQSIVRWAPGYVTLLVWCTVPLKWRNNFKCGSIATYRLKATKCPTSQNKN